MDEAGQVLIKHIFDSWPTLLRISGAILNNNKPAKAFAKRMGFKQDGLLQDFVTQDGQPRSVAHFGILRRHTWEVPKPQPQEVNPVNTVEPADKLTATPS
jgi:RimJ/RimL family protein N-acetyltransferase